MTKARVSIQDHRTATAEAPLQLVEILQLVQGLSSMCKLQTGDDHHRGNGLTILERYIELAVLPILEPLCDQVDDAICHTVDFHWKLTDSGCMYTCMCGYQ